MADVKFLSNLVIDGNIDLTAGAGYQIKNATFESLTADPTTNLFEGRMIYRSDTNQVRAYNGSSWTSIAGDIVGVTAGDGLGGGGTSGTVSLSVNVDDATIEINSDTVRAKTAAVTDGGTALATGGQIFTYIDNQGYTTNTGTVTSVGITAGSLIDVTGSAITTSGTFTIDVDLSELTDMTANVVTTQDEIVLLDNGVQRRKLFSEVFGALAYLGAVSTAHIADLNVTTGKLAADAVTGDKIADNAIDSEHYTDGSIDSVHLAADVVTAAKIADDAISDEHLDVTAITGQTDLGDAFADADTLLVYDASATALKEGTVKNLANYMQDELTFTTNTDTDVSVSNLETRLGQINSNVTIGNGASVAVSTSGNLTVGGNLIVDGTTTTVNSTTVAIDDHHFKVATDNSAANDFGFYGRYNSTAEYAGLTYDVSADTWILYSGNSTEPANTTFAPDARAGLKVARIDATSFTFNGTGITATGAELNLMDGGTSRGTTALADADGFIHNDGGTMKQTRVSKMSDYVLGKITGAISDIKTTNLTANRALASDANGKVATLDITVDELNYLDGVTSAIQTQLNGKQATMSAGDGIDISSNTISVDLTGTDSIGQLAADGSGTAMDGADFLLAVRGNGDVQRIAVDDLGVGTSNASTTVKGIVELATTNETLSGSDGTRAVTPAALAGTKYIATIGDGSATSYTVTHSLGSRRVMVQLYDSSSYEQVYAQVVRTTSSAITVDFNTAPATNDITVLVELIN